jgi:hypothetical protein
MGDFSLSKSICGGSEYSSTRTHPIPKEEDTEEIISVNAAKIKEKVFMRLSNK